jgi:Putative adhesin
MKKLLFLFALLYGVSEMAAQSTLQVVTKTVQKSIDWKPGYTVEINCEKADVEVITAAAGSKSVSVKAEMTARHPQLDSAKYDLQAWKFVTSTVGKTIYIRAYIGLKSGQPLPNANLKVRIFVQVPDQCPVTLANKFGKALLEHLTGTVRITGEFCALTLVDLQGDVLIESQYGNVDGRQLAGKVDIQTKRATIALSELRGNCSVHSEFGAVSVSNSPQMGNLYINSNKGDVTVAMGSSPPRHNFTLSATYGELKTPSNPSFDLSTNGNTRQATLHQGTGRLQVTVETTLGKITIQ